MSAATARKKTPTARKTAASRKKRTRRKPSDSKNLILDTTEKLMMDEGYAAVSTRRVASELGLTAALVHYYYPTTDDLFIALHRRMTERQLDEMNRVFESADPLREFWRLQSSRARAALGVEFIALANHRKTIRAEISRYTEQAREQQARALAPLLDRAVLDPGFCPPIALAALLVSVARMLVNEEAIGIVRGHVEVRAFVAAALARIAVQQKGRTSDR